MPRKPKPARGDEIRISIGDNARNVAAGKNVRQAQGSPVTASNEELAAIKHDMSEMRSTVSHLANLSETQRVLAADRLAAIEAELAKPVPNPTLITPAIEWLLDNVPEIAKALAGLLATPVVSKILGTAGALLINLVKARL